MKDFKKLKVWQDAIDLTELCYRYTDQFPPEEKYEMTSQIRRASYSIPTNIAEGSARETDKAFNQFLRISLGSAFELETFFIIAQRVYPKLPPPDARLLQLLNNEQRMLVGLMKKLK